MNLTVKQLKKACSKFPYLIIREYGGGCFAINSKVADLSRIKSKCSGQITRAISYKPCSFNEYISRKNPFLYPNQEKP